MAATGEFVVGNQYPDFEAVKDAIQRHQKATGVQFWRRDARTVESAASQVKRPLSADLKYYDVRYCCIHGGKKFKKQGEGHRQTK